MKPLEKCPECQCDMLSGQDDLSRWRACPNYWSGRETKKCILRPFERYIDDAKDVSYIDIHFDKFWATVYFQCSGHFPSHIAHLYSQVEMDERGVASPICRLKNFVPDLIDLEATRLKLALYFTFL